MIIRVIGHPVVTPSNTPEIKANEVVTQGEGYEKNPTDKAKIETPIVDSNVSISKDVYKITRDGNVIYDKTNSKGTYLEGTKGLVQDTKDVQTMLTEYAKSIGLTSQLSSSVNETSGQVKMQFADISGNVVTLTGNLEKAGDAGDVTFIQEKHPEAMKLFQSYKTVLEPYAKHDNLEKKPVPDEKVVDVLSELHDAIDGFDLDRADDLMKELETFKLPEQILSLSEQLSVAVTDVAMEEILDITQKMIEMIRG